MRTKPVFRWVVLTALLGVVGGCTKNTGPADTAAVTPSAESAAWHAFVSQYVEDTFKAQPFFAAQAGRHEFDGKMPDWSAAGIATEIARLRATRVAAMAFDSATLNNAQRF
jgi:hypothetical protein